MQTSRDGIFKPRIHAANFDEPNAMPRERGIAHARVTRHPEFKDRTIWEAFLEEQAALAPFQGPFRGLHEGEEGRESVRWTVSPTTAAVSKTPGRARGGLCLVSFDRNRYSVAARAVAPPAHLRLREEPVADCARHDRLIEGEGMPATGPKACPNRRGAA